MVDIKARAVVGAVGGFAAEQLDHAAHAALAHGILAFDNHGACAHADDHAVAAAVERQRRFFHAVVGGGSAGRQKARADPSHQVLAGHVVGGDHQHAAAAPAANPVFGE